MNSAPDGYVLNRQPPCPFGRARIKPAVTPKDFPDASVQWVQDTLNERKRRVDYWQKYYRLAYGLQINDPTYDVRVQAIIDDEVIMALVRPVGRYKLL